MEPAAPSPAPRGTLEAWVALARARWPTGAVVFVLVFGLAAAMVFLSRPVYRAEARLRIGEPPPMGGVSPTGGILSLFRPGGDAFANDLEVLRSRTLAERVVEDAALNAVLDAPRGWHRDSLFLTYRADRATDKATFEVRWDPDGAVRVRRTAPADSVIGTFGAGTPFAAGPLTLAARPRVAGMPVAATIRTLPFGEAVRRTRERIEAERARREANVADIWFDHTDPGVAQRATEAVVSRFLGLRTAIQRRESGETLDSLESVARQMLGQLARAERALEATQRRTRLVAPDVQSEAFFERYSETDARLAEARAQVEAVDDLLTRVDGDASGSTAWAELVAFPAFLTNPTVSTLLGQLTALEQQRTQLAARRTEANRDLQIVMQQIGRLESQLETIVHGYRDALREQVAELTRRQAALETQLAEMPPLAVDLARRQREVLVLSETYVLTQQRLRQEELRQALTFANIQVIDPPALRYKPVWPRKKLGLAVGFLLAGVFGVLAMVVHERAALLR